MSDENKIEEKDTKKLPVKKRYFFTFLAIIAVLVGGYFLYDTLGSESTDDAYVDTTTVSVSPKVSGQIVKVLVKDNQPVKAGQVVAVIDKIDYQVKLDQANAAYEKALLNQQNAHANLETKQAKQTTADQSIFSKNPAKSAKVADADLNVLKAQKRAAELALEYTDIKAPIDGTVSNKKVEVGMMVQPGSPLFVVVPHDVWVVANYKETQLTKMKEGMDVDVKIDAYPDKVFKCKIDSIQRSSGAKASMFPPENAVGSFVKIVQRIPVKIVFTNKEDLQEYSVIPGMSVVPKVKIREYYKEKK